jgi:monovalent cation/hydrogen antiporter
VLGLEIVVALGAATLICHALARRLGVTPQIMLLASGVLLGFVPALRGVSLPPQVMLLLFLPALLYWESLTTSLREIRNNLRVIVLASTVLVIATAAAAAAMAHAFGLPWGPAWVLGAAVAPTDATAVAAIARMLPRRTMTILRAESLVNDGTALVIYGVALSVTLGERRFSSWQVSMLFGLAYAGGALAGLVTAWLVVQVRRRLDDPLQENVVSVLTPFTAFFLATLVHGSGVFAVVVCGLTLSQIGPRLVHADTREQARAFWTLSTFVLNCTLFVLVGLQIPDSLRHSTSIGLSRSLLVTACVAAVVVGTRFAWLFTTPYVVRAVDRRPQQRLRRVGARARIVNGLAGFRGAVSLAAALAVPHTLASGAPFPDRDVIVFVTTGVIVATLLLGLLLPASVRWARLPEDTEVQDERRLAETVATEEAYGAIADIAARLDLDETAVARTRKEYEKHLAVLHSDGHSPDDEPLIRHEADYRTLRLELLGIKRSAVVRLRDEQQIDDTVLRQIQQRLDVEELRLTQRRAVE